MLALTANDFVMTLSGVVLVLGVITFTIGLFTLLLRFQPVNLPRSRLIQPNWWAKD